MKKIIMLCKHCKKEFTPIKKNAMYCSSSCRAKEWKINSNKVSPPRSLSDTLKGVISENDHSIKEDINEHQNADIETSSAITKDKDLVQKMLGLTDKLAPIKNEIVKIDGEIMMTSVRLSSLKKVFQILWFEHNVIGIIRNKTFRVKKGDVVFDNFMKALIPYRIFPFSEITMLELLGEGQMADYKMLCDKIRDKLQELSRYINDCNVKKSELNAKIKTLINDNRKTSVIPQKSNNCDTTTESVTADVTLNNDVTRDKKTEVTERRNLTSNPVISDKVITSQQLLDMHHKSFNFTGEWKEFLGQPEIDFMCAVYGMPGQGKSTFVTKFALYLAQYFGRVVYIAGEEGFRKTLKDKFMMNEALHANLFIADLRTFEDIMNEIPNDQYGYHFIIIDSLDNMHIDASKLKQLRVHYKSSAFITISQATKAGKMRGSNEIIHDADIEIEVKNGIALTKKNRFQKSNLEYKVFD